MDPLLDVNIVRIGKLSIKSGCKGYSSSAVLQAREIDVSNATLKGGDLLSQVPLQHDCCEELRVTPNLSGFTLETPHKNIISHLNDLRYASKKVSELEMEIKEQEKINHQTIQHHTWSIIVYLMVSAIVTYVG